MTRIPDAGRVKTRLIPALGPEGAASIHAALLRRTLRIAGQHARQSSVAAEVRYTGGTPDAIKSQCDAGFIWRQQQGNALGERMHVAIDAALNEGADSVIVIGTDCPDIAPDRLGLAWRLLENHDLVLGPADDGGYYLIGLKESDARLFTGVDWGTSHVLRQTQDRCRELKKSFTQLPVLSDIDEPENLVICRRFESDFDDCLPVRTAGRLSIVIPTLNEANQLRETVKPLLKHSDCEVIIADGGSTDGTVELAGELGCRVIAANRGRGRQLNAGAALASGEFLLFLHADTRVPATFREEIQNTLGSGAIAGAFCFQIDQPGWGLRCVECGTNLRARFLQLPYGDQGLFLRCDDFFRLGGFRNWPLMEDFELCRRLKKSGPIRLAPSAALTAGRRWVKLGVWRTMCVNQLCIAGWRLGMSPEWLAGWYSSRSEIRAERWHRISLGRPLLVVGLVLWGITFLFRKVNDSQPSPDCARHHEILEQMMEQNRLVSPQYQSARE
jgi:hypothetical protein